MDQDDNALFYQIMDELHGGSFTLPTDGKVVTDLSEILFYMDFAGIFDRTGRQKKYIDRQKKAECMFRPEGITLDFGSGPHRYLAFERSASMSRRAMLSFIREDFYEPIRRRIMMDLTIRQCQLSKLYAYNGLMMSSGIRVDGIGIDRPHRVIVIDNPTFMNHNVKVITVEDDGTTGSMRKYHRVEKRIDELVTVCFDGEGLISKQYAEVLNKALGPKRKHTSFQIRMPYVKGMLHQVDFKDLLMNAGTMTLTDMWGVKHSVEDVDIILTKSMFKGALWLKENGKSWEDYWTAFHKYHHALYITNVSKPKPEAQTELNFQFLNTLSMSAEEFRTEDLPLGWTHSPAEDSRDWLTKETELTYYNLCANEDYRVSYFTDHAVGWWRPQSKEIQMAKILKRNPLFISEPPYVKQLESEAEGILSRYAKGKLIVAGDNRFLSGDLFWLMSLLLDPAGAKTKRQFTFFSKASIEQFPDDGFYAPGAQYSTDSVCTILRNPHIARNEEIQLTPYIEEYRMREYYFGHLTDVLMVSCEVLAEERLGGADYDGDMVKTIAFPIVNQCVRRNYDDFADRRRNLNNIPLLMIPSVNPLIRDANDWKARFETVKNTFSSRVGQISNAALNRSIIAYNENSTAEERERYRQEVEILAILTGLEIDSAKSGVKPDLSKYLGAKDIKRSRFLRFKDIMDAAEENREAFLRQYLPEEFGDYFDLLTDFRCSGYRILGDLVCDCMDAYRLEDQRKLHNEQDSPAMTAMMDAYLNRASGAEYKTAVAQECRKQLEAIVKASEAVKYAVAIKDKDFLWDILYDKIYDHVKRAEVSRDAE